MSLTWSLQALLVRHETYVAEAEREKARMGAEIDQLGTDKKELEVKNASVIQDNRSLLDQLENLNNDVSNSDIHIQSLTATLQSTQAELNKLNNLASRTDELERELEQYEREQESLHAALAYKTEGEKSMTLRWKDAERKLAMMEDHLEAIERDARDERERHVEIVGRIERQRVVEKELETANGRLQGSAAAKTMARDKHGSTVVSHFVKDILQDNANLQVGIVELRDMLTSSNDEVERLRNQLAQYFPQDQSECADNEPYDSRRSSNLSQEISRASAQELHVHHHYHAPTSSTDSSRRISQTLRRPKKKRQGLTSGIYTPTSGSRTPRSSISGITPLTPSSTAILTPSSSATILSQTAVTVPGAKNPYRWSMQSAYTVDSSVASSPPSTTYQAPSIFDRGFSDAGMDSSRPTTPDSEDMGSPLFLPAQSKRSSGGYFRNVPALSLRYGYPEDTSTVDPSPIDLCHEACLDMPAADHDTILEEDEQDLLAADNPSNHQQLSGLARFNDDTDIAAGATSDFHPRSHRRVASHESLISISGMDIHTLKSRPSQLLTAQGGRSFSSQPVISATMAHASRPALVPGTHNSSRLLSGMAADQRAFSAGTSPRPTLGKKMGGWMFGKWGTTPTSAPTVAISTPLTNIKVQKLRDTAIIKAPLSPKLRPPGINCSGPIFGFGPEPQLPQEPVITKLDEEALRQSLSEV